MKAVRGIETKYYKTIFEQTTAGEYSVTLLPNTLYKLDIVGAGGGTYGSKVDYGNGGWTAVVRSGGSGGLISTYFYIPNDTDTTFTVTIGLGGVVENGVKGGNSTFALDDLILLVAEGGNGGSTSTDNAIGGITSIATEFENDYMIKQTQNNGNVGGIYRELHVKGSAYYSSVWCVANLSGGLSLIDNTQYGYGAGAGCVNVTPYNGVDGYCRIMQQTTEDDYEIEEETAIYKLPNKVYREYYKYQYSDWTQPVLTANGVIGGDSFAVSALNTDSRTEPYFVFDNNLSDNYNAGWLSKASNNYLQWYNPNPINITQLNILYQTTSASSVGYITNWIIRASNDGDNFIDIIEGTTGNYGSTIISINHEGYYKYWRIYPISWSSEWYTIINMNIIAQEQTTVEGTQSDYDFYKDILTYYGIR